MINLKRLLRENLGTVGMLLFAACFYLLFFEANHADQTTAKGSGPAMNQTKQSASQELKGKEELFKKNLESRPELLTLLSLVVLAVLGLGIAADIYFLRRMMRGLPLFPGALPQRDVRWGLAEVWKVFVFLFFIEAAIIFAEILFSSLFKWPLAGKDLVMMINSLFRDVAVAGLVIYWVKRRFKEPLSHIGLTTKNLFKNITAGILSYLALLPVLLAAIFIVAMIAQIFSYEPPPQTVVQLYLKESQKGSLVFFTFFVAIAGPAIEEIFFRGFAYPAFRTRFGVRFAILITAAIFALLHWHLAAFLPIFILGLCLASLYEKTGSLVPSMTLHMIHNLIMVGMTLGFKGMSHA